MRRNNLRSTKSPVLEPIVPLSSESFVWRRDDYPLLWSRWNAHSECEIHLIRNAEGTCYAGDYIGPFVSGDLFLIGADLPHNWLTPLEQGEKIAGRDVLLQFDGARLQAAGETLPELALVGPLLVKAQRGLKYHGAAREKGAALMDQIGASQGLARLAHFFELLQLLGRTEEVSQLSSTLFVPRQDPRADGILTDVFFHLSSHLEGDVRLSDMAEIAGMTETSFSRFFKLATGNTFSRHLTELRIARACEMLSHSDLPVTDICCMSGYDNISNFNRAFRKVRQMTPTEFRRLERKR